MHRIRLTPSVSFLMAINGFVYPILFLLMLVEGGDATLLITGFLIRFGLLNPLIAIPLAIIAAVSRDVLLYKIGRKYGKKFVEKFGKYLLITPEFFQKIENRLRKTKGKTVFFSKFIYGINHIAIIAVGSTKMDFRRFIKIDIFTILVWEAIMLSLGFFLANSFYLLKHYIKDFSIFLAIILAIFFLFEGVIRRFIKFNGNHD